jgi:hypothetical protein
MSEQKKHTLADIATLCREAAGPEGTIWCGSDSPITADTAYNLAKAGHAFFFLPMRLVKGDDFSYNILVIGDKEDLGSCMGQNGPRQDFHRAIAELKEVTQKIAELKPDRVFVETFPIIAGIPNGKIPTSTKTFKTTDVAKEQP